nr:putative rna-binding protein c22e12.02 [Quercus suber]
MAYNQSNQAYGYTGYEQTPPQIRNPFAPPPPTQSSYVHQNAEYDPEHEAQIAQWQSAYLPQDQLEKGKKSGKNDKGDNPNTTPIGVHGPVATEGSNVVIRDGKELTVKRKGGGEQWEDKTLLEWDPTQFRIQVGNLAGEVTDDSLAKAFASYGVAKARVIRDKRTTKSKGYGFVSFTDAEQGFKAAREMVNKYIGSHPVTIARAKTDVKPTVIKDSRHQKNKNNRNSKNKKNDYKEREQVAKQDDPLRAHTGAHIEKKPVRSSTAASLKMLG